MTVTAVQANQVVELGSRPAAGRVRELLDHLGEPDRDAIAERLHLGLVVSEHSSEYSSDDLVIRPIQSIDHFEGTVAIEGRVPLGASVQFVILEEQSARDDLAIALHGQRGDAALTFVGHRRGAQLFGDAHHDASLVQAQLSSTAVAGMFCRSEFGRVADTNQKQNRTNSTVFLVGQDRAGRVGSPDA